MDMPALLPWDSDRPDGHQTHDKMKTRGFIQTSAGDTVEYRVCRGLITFKTNMKNHHDEYITFYNYNSFLKGRKSSASVPEFPCDDPFGFWREALSEISLMGRYERKRQKRQMFPLDSDTWFARAEH